MGGCPRSSLKQVLLYFKYLTSYIYCLTSPLRGHRAVGTRQPAARSNSGSNKCLHPCRIFLQEQAASHEKTVSLAHF